MPPAESNSPFFSESSFGTSTCVVNRQRRNYWAHDQSEKYVNFPRVPPLGYLKQTRLIRDAQQGDTVARNEVWVHNLRLVLSAVNRLNIPSELLADVLQEGAIGIYIAIRKFEIERYGELSTYAWQWIMQRMMRCLALQRFRGQVPSHLYGAYCTFRREAKNLRSRNDWFDWDDDHRSTFPAHYSVLRRIYSLNELKPLNAARNLPSKSGEPSQGATDRDFGAMMWACLAELDERERNILCLRYGIGGGTELTLEEIGQELALTRERVRQVQKKAEERLARIVLRRVKSLDNIGFLRQREAKTQG